MISSTRTIILSILVGLALLFPGFIQKAEAKSRKKAYGFKGLKQKVKRNLKKAVKKTRRSVVKSGCAITNKLADNALKAKKRITGKKNKKTFVSGHYKKGNKHHTKGHTRRITRKKRPSSGGSSGSSGSPLPPAF